MIQLMKPLARGKQKEYIKVCEEAVNLMINLANDTIDLYKIRKGEFDIKEHEFRPSELDQKLQKLFKFSFE